MKPDLGDMVLEELEIILEDMEDFTFFDSYDLAALEHKLKDLKDQVENYEYGE